MHVGTWSGVPDIDIWHVYCIQQPEALPPPWLHQIPTKLVDARELEENNMHVTRII